VLKHSLIQFFIFIFCTNIYLHAEEIDFDLESAIAKRMALVLDFPLKEVPSIIQDKQEKIFLDFLSKDWLKKIDDTFFEPFKLLKLTYESDVKLDPFEFDYLFGLVEGDVVTVDALKKGIGYFELKDHFEGLEISWLDFPEGKQLHLVFKGFWVFDKLRFHGVLIGKENFRQYYMLESGQRFDLQKHEASIKKIEESLESLGYFNSSVSSYFDYNIKTKSLVVNIVLDKDECFKINSIKLNYKGLGDKDSKMELVAEVEKELINSLVGSYCSQVVLDKYLSKFRKDLSHKVFLSASFEMQKNINFESHNVDLEFDITVHQQKEFDFFGNRFFSSRKLTDYLLGMGPSITQFPISILSQEIMNNYFNSGFWKVSVEANEDGHKCSFIIKEGLRAKITEVAFKGAAFFKEDELEGFLAKFLKIGFFDADSLKRSLKKMADFYLKEGFWNFKVLKQDYVPLSDDKEEYKLVVIVEEGSRRFLQKVSVDGFAELEKEDVFNQCLNQPFDFDQIEKQKKFLMEYFHKKGFLFADAKPEMLEKDGQVCISWKINLGGGEVKFGKTVMQGDSKFPLRRFLREQTFEYGDQWDRGKINQTVSKLRGLDVFETVNLNYSRCVGLDHERPVVFRLADEDNREIRIRCGIAQVSKNFTFRSGTTYKFGTSLLFRNLTNHADILVLNADITRFYRKTALFYQRPWIGRQPLFTVVKAYSNKYDQPLYIGSDRTLYQALQEGGLIGVTRKFANVDFGINCGCEWMKTSGHRKYLSEAINFSSDLIGMKVPYFYTEPTLFLDFLDNKLNPRSGSLSIFSLKGMFPIKEEKASSMLKFLIEQSVFFPFDEIVLALRFRFGHIFRQVFKEIMPPERFFLGGANSLRSYQADFCPPLGCFVDEHGRKQYVPQGGKSMINCNFELRMPVYNQLGLVLFQDIGVLLADSNPLKFYQDKLLAGTGFGLRYNTPIGPVRFDIGWKWSKCYPKEGGYSWFLTLGQAF